MPPHPRLDSIGCSLTCRSNSVKIWYSSRCHRPMSSLAIIDTLRCAPQTPFTPSSAFVDRMSLGYAGVPVRQGGVAMLIIDPQNDFHPGGSLAIQGANEDSERIANLISKISSSITQINVTLDSHQYLHIAHAIFWKNEEGAHPDPFTTISLEDVRNGRWKASRPEFQSHAEKYVETLEAQGKFQLVVWPPHCIMGTQGHQIAPAVAEACHQWASTALEPVFYVHKGQHPLTEMYSAIKAEVEIEGDPSTSLNQELVNRLQQADLVLVCGEAKSHCVNFTLRDLVGAWPKSKLGKLVLLTDGCSSVAGFEKAGDDFVADMKQNGVTVVTAGEAEQLVQEKLKS